MAPTDTSIAEAQVARLAAANPRCSRAEGINPVRIEPCEDGEGFAGAALFWRRDRKCLGLLDRQVIIVEIWNAARRPPGRLRVSAAGMTRWLPIGHQRPTLPQRQRPPKRTF